MVIAVGVVIKNRAKKKRTKIFSRDIYYAFAAIPRVQMHRRMRALYTFHLREILNSARFEFISNAAKPLSMRVELAVLGPWRGNNSRVKEVGGLVRAREREKRRLKKEGGCNGKRVEWRGMDRGVGERAPYPRDSLRKVQRYKAPVIYFGLPWLVYPLVLVRSLLDVFKRTSNEYKQTA